MARLAEAVAGDWPDAGRAGLDASGPAGCSGELARSGRRLAGLSSASRRRAGDDPAASRPGGRGPGIRLGGTDGHRADDERGVRIAELPAR